MAPVLVFDVNETLLDLGVLDRHFERMFGDPAVRRRWFGLVLRNALTLTITGAYHDFVAVGAASLAMVADEHGVELTESDRVAISESMVNLPPHSDVAPNLTRLSAEGFTITALTNSPQSAAERQLAAAGLDAHFDRIMSVAAVGRFKPAPEVYRMASDVLETPLSNMTMVAAHDWDIAGAMAVGLRGAYITRPGMVLNPLFPAPDISGPDLTRVTDLLIQTPG